MTEESKLKAKWAGYFERLDQADPSAVELDVRGVTIPIVDPPINCDPPLFVATQAAVNGWKWKKSPKICGIHAELLKASENAVLMSLHAFLCSAWKTGIIPTDWKRGLVFPLWKGKGDRQDCNKYQGVMLLSVLGKVFAQIIIDRIHHHLFEHQRPEQLGFTLKRSTIDCNIVFRVLTEPGESFVRGCLQPMLISVKGLIQ